MKVKKLLALLVAIVMTASSFTACGQKEQSEPSTAVQPSDQSQTDDTMVGNMYKQGFPIVKEKESFRILMNNAADPAAMKIWQDYAEKTNVDIKWEYYDYATSVEKKNLMYATQEYPDAIGTWLLEDNDILTYANSVFIPIEESIAKYAPNITNALDNFPNGRAITTAPDGHIYSLGIMAPQADCGWIMHINKKWLDNLGLQVPETIQDFENVLKAFKEKDANGNGNPNDEISFSFFDDAANYVYGSLFGSFGRLDNKTHLVLENGKVTFTANKDEYKEGIKWLNSLYSQKLVDQEAFTQDKTQYETKGKSGDASLYGVYIDFMGVNTVGESRYKDEYISLAPLAGSKGTRIWGEGDQWIFRTQFAITKSAKNPDTIVRWLDGLFEPEMSYQVCYGQLNEFTEKTLDGKYQYKPFKDSITESDIRNNYTVCSLPYCIMPEFNNNIVPNSNTLIKKNADARVLPFVTKEPYPVVWKTAEQNEELAVIQGDIKKLVDDKRVQWITGHANIDNEWDKYVKDLETINVGKYIEINQAAVDAYNKNIK